MSAYLTELAGRANDLQNEKDKLEKLNSEKIYDLYFSKIIYSDLYYPDSSIRRHCLLHGNELESGEEIEVKFGNNNIEKFVVQIKVELFGWSNKQYTPYVTIKYNDTELLTCVDNLLARRLHEPKNNK